MARVNCPLWFVVHERLDEHQEKEVWENIFTYMAILMKVSERGWRGDVQVWTHEWSAIGVDLEAVRNNNELEKDSVLKWS